MLERKRKKQITAVLVALLIGLYIVIFCFSADDGEESSSVSMQVTKALLKLYYGTSAGGTGSGAEMVIPADDVYALEGIVRKAAHFTEYMCVGILSYTLALMWIGTGWRGRLPVLVQLIVSAGLDEWHQFFVPGRHASIRDVAIDTAGGIAGMLLLLLIKAVIDKGHKIISGSTRCSPWR